MNDVEITGGFIAIGAQTTFPRADFLLFLRMAAVDVDGAVLNPEVGVLAKFAADGGDGGGVELPDGEAFFLMGPVLGNGIDLMFGVFSLG